MISPFGVQVIQSYPWIENASDGGNEYDFQSLEHAQAWYNELVSTHKDDVNMLIILISKTDGQTLCSHYTELDVPPPDHWGIT